MRNNYRIQQARFDLQFDQLNLQLMKRQFELNASASRNSVGSAYAAYLSSQKQEKAAITYRQLIEKGYQEGVSSFIETLDARSQQIQAQLASSIARYKVLTELANYDRETAKQFLPDNLITEVIGKMDKMKLPAGYAYKMGGEFESRQESFGGFGTIILVTVFLFIAVLVLEFKTFKSTMIVLSVIPLGIVGAILALWLTGNSLSFVAIIGLIALAGIEVKNSILLVDFTNQLRREGRSLDDAIREAGEIRFLPIILTSLTAIGGLLPIAISTNPLISPLAIVLIGGLISSTLLSRIVTPIIYKLIPPSVTAKAE
jgi:multidrug efflux pump subunit AcrB